MYHPPETQERFYIDDFFGLGYIGECDQNIFISDELHFLIFSLPTIIQLPNGRWVVQTHCLPDSERDRIIWRVKHSGFRFCPTVYKMTWAEFIAHDCCNSYCNRCDLADFEMNGDLDVRFDFDASPDELNLPEITFDLPKGITVKSASRLDVNRPNNNVGPDPLGNLNLLDCSECVDEDTPIGVTDINGKKLLAFNRSDLLFFDRIIASAPIYFNSKFEALMWQIDQPESFSTDTISLYNL